MLEQGSVTKIKIIKYSGDFNDVIKALITTKNGEIKVFNVINADNFMRRVSDIQAKNGVIQMEQVPMQIDFRSPLHMNIRTGLNILISLAFIAMWFQVLYSVRSFIKFQQNNVNGFGKLRLLSSS